MPVVMREKMEGAFGMDLSGVKLYENKAVGKAGAEAVTQGSKIAFAPGRLDFSSTHGQALLGHEISHVASQARGEVKGSGLVNDSALEARADREGLMAARGESITMGYGGAAASLSNASVASSAGPMQAKSGKKARAKADFESTQLLPSDEGWTEDDLFDARMEQQEKSERIARDLEREERDNDPDDMFYNEDFDRNGIITGNGNKDVKNKAFRSKNISRGGLKWLYDSFRTTGSHWFTGMRNKKSRDLMNRMDMEMANMVSLEDAAADNELDDFPALLPENEMQDILKKDDED